MAYLEAIYDALRARIGVVWPEVLPNGIWEAEHASLIPYETLTPPYAVLLTESLPKGQWSGSALTRVPDVKILYVLETSGPLSGLRDRLEGLETDLWTQPLAHGQVLDIPDLSWSDALEPNQILIAKGLAHRAGQLTATLLTGRVFVP